MKKKNKQPKIVSFLASGRGSNFEAVARQIKKKRIKAKLGILIVDKPAAGALKIAADYRMPAFYINPKEFSSKSEYEQKLVELLKEHQTDLVVAAGFMRLLSATFLTPFKNRVINIHPALLPAFPGLHAQRQAVEYGVKLAGCTVHFVDEGMDSGPIILQSAVEVRPEDTEEELAARIIKEEHQILPKAVKLICSDKINIAGRKVYIK